MGSFGKGSFSLSRGAWRATFNTGSNKGLWIRRSENYKVDSSYKLSLIKYAIDPQETHRVDQVKPKSFSSTCQAASRICPASHAAAENGEATVDVHVCSFWFQVHMDTAPGHSRWPWMEFRRVASPPQPRL